MSGVASRLGSIEAIILDVDGVLTDGRLYYGPDGEEMKSFHVRDGLGLALLRECGLRRAIVSGRASAAVEKRAAELGFDPCLLARIDKAAALDEICKSWGIAPASIAAMGDDLIDLPLLSRVGVSFAPRDADSRVLAAVDVVVDADGGRGAVRGMCEQLLLARPEGRASLGRFLDGISS